MFVVWGWCGEGGIGVAVSVCFGFQSVPVISSDFQ